MFGQREISCTRRDNILTCAQFSIEVDCVVLIEDSDCFDINELARGQKRGVDTLEIRDSLGFRASAARIRLGLDSSELLDERLHLRDVFEGCVKGQDVLVDDGAGLGCQLIEWARHVD